MVEAKGAGREAQYSRIFRFTKTPLTGQRGENFEGNYKDQTLERIRKPLSELLPDYVVYQPGKKVTQDASAVVAPEISEPPTPPSPARSEIPRSKYADRHTRRTADSTVSLDLDPEQLDIPKRGVPVTGTGKRPGRVT